MNLFQSRESASETRENLRALAAENKRLQERSQTLMETSSLTREARRQGMVTPGERPYVIRDLGG